MIVDFGQQDELPTWFKRFLFAWLARYQVHPIAEIGAALAEIAGRKGLTLKTEKIGRGYAFYAELERAA